MIYISHMAGFHNFDDDYELLPRLTKYGIEYTDNGHEVLILYNTISSITNNGTTLWRYQQ